MENATGPKGFIARMSDYYGRKPGQSVKEFGDELKALTPKDKDDFVKWFNDAGLPTTPMTVVTPAK